MRDAGGDKTGKSLLYKGLASDARRFYGCYGKDLPHFRPADERRMNSKKTGPGAKGRGALVAGKVAF